MSIRPMTPTEIVAGLRRAAVVCVEQQRKDWWCYSVCVAHGTFSGAWTFYDRRQVPATPEHAALFLLLCAEAHDAA